MRAKQAFGLLSFVSPSLSEFCCFLFLCFFTFAALFLAAASTRAIGGAARRRRRNCRSQHQHGRGRNRVDSGRARLASLGTGQLEVSPPTATQRVSRRARVDGLDGSNTTPLIGRFRPVSTSAVHVPVPSCMHCIAHPLPPVGRSPELPKRLQAICHGVVAHFPLAVQLSVCLHCLQLLLCLLSLPVQQSFRAEMLPGPSPTTPSLRILFSV